MLLRVKKRALGENLLHPPKQIVLEGIGGGQLVFECAELALPVAKKLRPVSRVTCGEHDFGDLCSISSGDRGQYADDDSGYEHSTNDGTTLLYIQKENIVSDGIPVFDVALEDAFDYELPQSDCSEDSNAEDYYANDYPEEDYYS